MYILSSVRVSIHMYEAQRAMAGCSCSEKEQINNLRITNNLKNTKFLDWLIPMNWFSLLPEYGVRNQMVSTKADRYTIIAGKKKVTMVDLCSGIVN